MTRKPHSKNAGYIAERVSHHPKLPGHFVIYHAQKAGIDADHALVVVHEPSSYHIACVNRQAAYDLMNAMAQGSDDFDFGQND